MDVSVAWILEEAGRESYRGREESPHFLVAGHLRGLQAPRRPTSPVLAMCRYHSLVDGAGCRGNMVRSWLCLSTCNALAGNPGRCLLAAVSVELIHRPSLIFDYIQDRRPQRNHRHALWRV